MTAAEKSTEVLVSPGDAGDARDGGTQSTSEEADAPRKSAATRLVELARDLYTLNVDTDGTPYAVEIDGPNLALPFRGGRLGLRAQLANAYWHSEGRVAPAGALADALTALEGEAASSAPVACGMRLAAHDGGVLLDLGDAEGRVVEVAGGGWRVRSSSPLTFRRSALTGVLPMPVDGGDLDLLRDLVNVTDASWAHLLGWLVAALIPGIPHPVLSLHGEMGTGKSTNAASIVSLIDPSPAPLRSAPRDVDSWAIAAAGSWVVGIDNVSAIAPWFSDALCRAVTGDGLVRRQLYTDGDLVVLAFRRCIILTAIDAGALRGDLADRLVRVGLEPIAPERRRTDADLAAELEQARPLILGALLDIVAQVLEVLPTVVLDTLPRMADYAKVLAAVDRVTGLDCLPRYLALGSELMADVVADDPVAVAVQTLTERSGGRWTGTAGDLFDRITPDRPPKGWPANPRSLSAVLKNASTALRSVGTEVTFQRTGTARTITCEMVRDLASSASLRHSVAADQAKRHDATGDATPITSDANNPSDAIGDATAPPCVTPITAGHTPYPGADDANDAPEQAFSEGIDTDAWEADYPDLFDLTDNREAI